MPVKDNSFETLTQGELWQRYCGFLDLSVKEFMDIQSELLLDEIDRIADSVLGKKIMGNTKPKNMAEFRSVVPITRYDDYEPYLSERQENALAEKPYLWCHSAGKGGKFKWVPYTSQFLDVVINRVLGGFILASTAEKGRVNISPGFRFLSILPPGPYATGSVFKVIAECFPFKIIPPLSASENLEFQERIQAGFQLAMKDGVDLVAGISSVLVKMGEAFSDHTRSMTFSPSMLHPKIVARLLLALMRSKMEKRPILPKDLWPARALAVGGVDTSIYRDKLAYYWGSEPYEFYGCTEIGLTAFQAWNKKWMVFSPDNAFLEFLPESELSKLREDKGYRPSTVLLGEVEAKKRYELVITQLYGMPLLRYRTGDLFEVVSLEDNDTGIKLPQIAFQRRVDEIINIGSMAWLDEKTIWRALSQTGIKFTEWTACKEYAQSQSYVRIYLELKENRNHDEIASMIDEQLKAIDTDYKDIGIYLGFQPIKVTLLSPGTFGRYMAEKRKEGADLAHLKPSHINPDSAAISNLLQLSEDMRKQ